MLSFYLWSKWTSFDCRLFLNRFPVCLNFFLFLCLVSPCLVVAVHPCMEWIPIKKKENRMKCPTWKRLTSSFGIFFYLIFTENLILTTLFAAINSLKVVHLQKNRWPQCSSIFFDTLQYICWTIIQNFTKDHNHTMINYLIEKLFKLQQN